MFLGMLDFDFTQILITFVKISPKFAQKNFLGDTAASPFPTALHDKNLVVSGITERKVVKC